MKTQPLTATEMAAYLIPLILLAIAPLIAGTNAPVAVIDSHVKLTPDSVVFRYQDRTYEAIFTVTNHFASVVLAGQTQTVGAISGRTLMPTEIRLVEPKPGPPLPGVTPPGTMKMVAATRDFQVPDISDPTNRLTEAYRNFTNASWAYMESLRTNPWTGRVQFIPNSVVPSYLDTNVARAMTNFQGTPR